MSSAAATAETQPPPRLYKLHSAYQDRGPLAVQNVLASMSLNFPRQPALTANKKNIKFAVKILPCLTYHTQTFESWLGGSSIAQTLRTRLYHGNQRSNQKLTGKLLIFNNPKLGTVLQSIMSGRFLETNFDSHSHSSMGVLALTCLDLPPKSRNKPANIFIAGMIPAPTEPDMTMISHILAPLFNELLLLNTGIFIKTHNFPIGRRLSIHRGALIGDVVASHKLSGFASHLATFFCSWCKCKKSEMMHMQLGPMRKQHETRLQALCSTACPIGIHTIDGFNGHLNPIHLSTALTTTDWKILKTKTQRTHILARTS
ncbi:hypothetical protein VP01_7148g1 [Puccinia sorghi]|uniref:Uncharacterized protein n=1 Tax=Puccinia sorghi TaxID=27349 RepID=A0A0L6UDJ0_9BASI|nr:hypothetical protein VP01_7148g1 [Puccinia sorghi]